MWLTVLEFFSWTRGHKITLRLVMLLLRVKVALICVKFAEEISWTLFVSVLWDARFVSHRILLLINSHFTSQKQYIHMYNWPVFPRRVFCCKFVYFYLKISYKQAYIHYILTLHWKIGAVFFWSRSLWPYSDSPGIKP